MAQLSWLGEELSIEDALVSLGHTKTQVKKCGLTKKQRLKKIRKRSVLEIPESLFNRFEAYPVYGDCDKEPRVIEESAGFIALSKPSYVHSHPLSYFEKDNLISFLKQEKYFSYLNPNRDTSFDRGLLYRLDYETSGLVVFTSNDSLLKQLRSGEVSPELKLYQAVVEGEYKAEATLRNKLTSNGKRVYSDEQGKDATILVRKLSYNEELNLSLLEVTLREGLRHQIRAQLSYAGHPILGDVLYGAKASEHGFGLHCCEYRINSETFRDVSFESLKLFVT